MKTLENAGGGAVSPGAWPRGARTLLVTLLLGAIDLGYARSLDGEMQFDDFRLVTLDPRIKDLSHSGAYFLSALGIAGRAFTDLTFAINYRLNGVEVRGYHLVNLAAHLLAVLAILALTTRILERVRWPVPFATALVVSALFGLHPIQSEAVSYIFQRAEVLGSLFYALSLLLALRALERGLTSRGGAAFAGALACGFLGWCSKPMVATLPAALLLVTALLPAPAEGATPLRQRAGRLLLFSLPFWALTALFSSFLFAGLRGSTEAGFSVPTSGGHSYLLTQPRVILTYLRLLAWPSGQNLDWDVPPSASLLEPKTALAFAAVLLLLGAAAWLLRWSSRPARDGEAATVARLAGFGILWFFLLLLPTSSVVPLLDVMAEHRVYLACWGLFLPAAAGGTLVVRRLAPEGRGAIAGGAVALAVSLALLVALYRRNAVWETELSLWTDVVAKSPGKPRGHLNLAHALIPIDPERAVAETAIVERLATDPGTRAAAAREGAEILNNLAADSLQAGQLEQARTLASRAIARWPDYASGWLTLGQLDAIAGDYRGAAARLQRAAALEPDSPAIAAAQARVQQLQGDTEAACASWARAARAGGGTASSSAAQAMAALGCRAR